MGKARNRGKELMAAQSSFDQDSNMVEDAHSEDECPDPGGGGPLAASLRASLDPPGNEELDALAWNFDDMMPPSEKILFTFNSKDELKRWHLYSDSEYGGSSAASLEIKDSDVGSSGIFSGNLSLDMVEGSTWKLKSSGFCGMRSKKFNGFIDLDAYDTIAMKVRGDGRSYISTIYTENWINSPGQQEDESWQAFVYSPKDEWCVVKIPLAHYIPTWRGMVIEADLEMNPARILGTAISVNQGGGIPGTKSGPGDFRLEIDSIKALRT